MKIDVHLARNRSFPYTYNPVHIIPFLKIFYKADLFLETGVYTKAIIFEFGWLTRTWSLIFQEH